MQGYFSIGPLQVLAYQGSLTFLTYKTTTSPNLKDLQRIEVVKALLKEVQGNGISFLAHDADNLIIDSICRKGSLKIIKYLVENGIWRYDPDYYRYKMFDDIDPLASSCEEGRLDIIKYLVDESKSAEIENVYERGFYYACVEGHVRLAKYINSKIEDDINDDILVRVGEHGSIKMVKYLISMGYDLMYSSNDLFRHVCAFEYFSIIKYLIAIEGDTPIEGILSIKNLEIRKYLALSSIDKIRAAMRFNRILGIKDLLIAL